jgi:hypothetical protein
MIAGHQPFQGFCPVCSGSLLTSWLSTTFMIAAFKTGLALGALTLKTSDDAHSGGW